MFRTAARHTSRSPRSSAEARSSAWPLRRTAASTAPRLRENVAVRRTTLPSAASTAAAVPLPPPLPPLLLLLLLLLSFAPLPAVMAPSVKERPMSTESPEDEDEDEDEDDDDEDDDDRATGDALSAEDGLS